MKAASFIAALLCVAVAFGALIYFVPTRETPDEPPKKLSDAVEEMVADIDPDGPHAVAVVDDPGETFHFGQMVLGDSDEHTFVVRNEGDVPLVLKKLFNTCKCTLSDLEEAEVAPGDELEITLTYTPKAAEPEFSQGAVIGTNDPETKELRLSVIGAVTNDVMILPTDVWNLGTIRESRDEPTTVSGAVVSGSQENFRVLEMIPGNEAITAEISNDITPEELEASDGLSGSVITLTVQPEVPVGRFSIPVRFKTNSERDASKEILITVGGTRSGPFSILGAGWIGANSRLSLGRFQAEEGISRTLTMFIDKADEPIDFELVDISPSIAEVKFERDESYKNEKREKGVFTVTIPPGVRPGLYEEAEERVRVKMKSNHPLFDEFNFEIAFRAE